MATIKGGHGHDDLVGTSGNDLIYGYQDDDSIAGGNGADTIRGGGGDDSINGENGADRIHGDTGNDIISGGADADQLYGDSGIDALDGGLGNDLLDGGAGDDMMAGGLGNDVYLVDTPGDVVTEIAGEGTDSVRSSVSYVLGDTIERLYLIGTANVDATGNGGANIIRGNSGDNVLSAGAGDDVIVAGAGDDIITGGTGRDIATGGAGADTFVYHDGDFSGMTRTSADRIADFSSVQGDTIDLQNVDADTVSDGDQAFQFIGSDAFHSVAGELRFENIDSDTYVYGDTNGDGSADFAIRLVGSHALTGTDFVM